VPQALNKLRAHLIFSAKNRQFSVSPTLLPDAETYVRHQEEHHRTKTFQEEFREFLSRYGIEYDERYVWD